MGELLNAGDYLVSRRLEAGDGNRVALEQGSERVTYAELAARVGQAANALRALGVRPEERVPLVLLDGVEFVASFLGALRIGAVPVPLSTMLTGGELAFQCNDARARVAVASAALAPVLKDMVAQCAELTDLVVAGDGHGDFEVTLAGPLRVYRYEEWTSNQPAEAETYPTWPDSPAFWLYTSGTTGRPKAAMHRHADLPYTAETYGQQVLGITPADRCYSVAKLFFAYGLGNSLTFPLSLGACTILDPARPTPQGVAATVRERRPTLFFAVPTFYAALLAADLPRDTFASVRLAVSAGEPLPAGIFHRFKERFAVDILDGLGTTEALHIFISNRPGDIRPGSTGFVVPGYRVRLVNDEGGAVQPGETGHLLVSGESVATGYWCRTDVNRRTFQGEWLRTGDVYSCSEDGVLSYAGRSDDMIKSGGIWVSPAEVEATLVQHPDVLEAAVVGRRTAEGLQEPAAYVVRMPGRSPGAEELTEFCRQRLAAFKRPRQVVFVDDLPKTATGKIQRYKLRNA
ncbi:MAG TPA: benzoate-CoA ligase family protein [Actinomycetes bacterium]|jgi:benzoate-CoA ligase family protein|nr:benzoate-CoA ligase family protein [Actinomycetes bacterium]